MKFRFIDDHQGTWPVRIICRALRVSPSGSYAWRARPESTRAAANRMLLDEVRRLHARHHGRYGSPRMHAALRAEGRGVSRGRIERLMCRHGIRAVAARRYRPGTTDSRHGLPVAPNLLEQRFTASAPNQVWLADITYVPTGEGWLYLAAVLDLATRKVVAGRCAITCALNSLRPPCSWPSSGSVPRRGSSNTLTVAANMRRASTGDCWPRRA